MFGSTAPTVRMQLNMHYSCNLPDYSQIMLHAFMNRLLKHHRHIPSYMVSGDVVVNQIWLLYMGWNLSHQQNSISIITGWVYSNHCSIKYKLLHHGCRRKCPQPIWSLLDSATTYQLSTATYLTNSVVTFICWAMKNCLLAWTINEPHLPYKTGLNVMQSHPLHRTRFSQYQASCKCLYVSQYKL